MFDIKANLKKLPALPGVYIMHDKDDKVIYVGKAKILKNRVKQYFGPIDKLPSRTQAMVSKVSWFEYIVTDSELEALVLECNLIKKHRPRYNVLLKDDKNYPYIKVTVNEEYPRLIVTRKMENDGARYFGPYTGMATVKNTIEVIRRIFKIPTCSRRFPKDIGKQRPCLNFQIKRCMGVCTGQIDKDRYKEVFLDICDFLQGDHQKIIAQLTEQMNKRAAELDFEAAAQIRDKIYAINQISEKQKIVSDLGADQDVCAFVCYNDIAFFEVFFIRAGRINGRSSYRLDKIGELSDSQIMSAFIKQFYAKAAYIPSALILQQDIDEKEVTLEWLSDMRGRRVKIEVPKRGDKLALVKMVLKNANMALKDYKLLKLKDKTNEDILTKLSEYLGLSKLPSRIEGYDISNIAGADNVGAMVVFTDGVNRPELLRKFSIKTVSGADDYMSMKEMLWRRIMRAKDEQKKTDLGELDKNKAKFLPLPDLILVDGGKGHVSSAKKVLEELGVNIAVFGMVKDERHRTRALTDERKEIALPKNSAVFALIGRIQEEVHRVAIGYHKSLRTKKGVISELSSIEGIGEVRRKLLLKRFKTIDAIRNASIDELTDAGLDTKSAKNVYNHFR